MIEVVNGALLILSSIPEYEPGFRVQIPSLAMLDPRRDLPCEVLNEILRH